MVDEIEETEPSSGTESEISLSEKIVLESNEKRLRQRMTSLQNSILGLKEQLKLEKEMWKEDMAKIKMLQQQELRCACAHLTVSKDSIFENSSRSSSNYTLGSVSSKSFDDILKKYSIKQLLELQNYKRRLAETENMCNLELHRVKQSLENLCMLKSIASEWGKSEEKIDESSKFEEFFVNSKSE